MNLVRLIATSVKVGCEKANGHMQSFARYFVAVYLSMLLDGYKCDDIDIGTHKLSKIKMNRNEPKWTRTPAELSPVALLFWRREMAIHFKTLARSTIDRPLRSRRA
jgi:hypothetical protein